MVVVVQSRENEDEEGESDFDHNSCSSLQHDWIS